MKLLALGCHRVVADQPLERGMDISQQWLNNVIQLPFLFTTVREALSISEKNILSLTFDDGDVSIHTQALPILSEAGIRATVFVSPSREQWMREMLHDLLASGWEIGSHSLTHPPLDLIDTRKASIEIQESRYRLEDLIGTAVYGFAFPYGRYGPREMELVYEAGYIYAVGTLPFIPISHYHKDVRIVPRLMCDDWTTLQTIELIARSRMARFALWLQDEIKYQWNSLLGIGFSPYRVLPESWTEQISTRGGTSLRGIVSCLLRRISRTMRDTRYEQ